jgi:type I restriction enzyme S subunit
MSWPIVTLGNLVDVKGGKRLPKGESYHQSETKHPYIRVTDFINGSVNIEGLEYISEETHNKIQRYTISKNDVYISIAGSIGIVGKIPPSLDGANLTENAAKLVIKDDQLLDQDFLIRFLSTQGQDQIQSKKKATSQPKLALFRIEEIEVPLPPLEEQKRIAAILDKADAIRQKRKQAIDLADEFLRSVFLDMFGDPNDESSQRELISFGKLGGNENNKRIPLKQSDRDLREGEYPYYGATGVIDYVDDYVFDGDYLLIAEDGKNLVNRTKPLAFPANGKFWVNNHSHVIRNTGTVDLVYLEFYLNLKDIRKYVTGIDQFKLNRKSLDSMPIYLPDMELQRKFSSLVKLTLSSSGKMLNGLELLGEQFNSLSQKAFSGQL